MAFGTRASGLTVTPIATNVSGGMSVLAASSTISG